MNSLNHDPASTLMSLWNWRSPAILVAILALVVYARWQGKWAKRGWCFLAATAIFLFALISPLNVLAHGYLFSAHMVQHLLLLLIVPGLVMLSLSRESVEGLLRNRMMGGMARVFGYPLIGWAMGTGAMWFWHVPMFCVASQTNASIGLFQTVSLLFMGSCFWWPVFSPVPAARVGALQGVGYLFTGCVACTVLGVYLTFSPVSVCPSFLTAADPLGIMPYLRGNLGLTPANDQQVGGLLMWVPACLIYMTGSFTLLGRWYSGRPETLPDAQPAPLN